VAWCARERIRENAHHEKGESRAQSADSSKAHRKPSRVLLSTTNDILWFRSPAQWPQGQTCNENKWTLTRPDWRSPSWQPWSVKWVVAQIYKVCRFTFYNINRKRKPGLTPSAGFVTDLEHFLPLFLLQQAPRRGAFLSEWHHFNRAPQPFWGEVVPNFLPLIRHWQQELSVSIKVSKNL